MALMVQSVGMSPTKDRHSENQSFLSSFLAFSSKIGDK